jgi:hypothetical protein
MKPLRRNISLAFAALLLSASVAASQNAPAPRTDGEGINMDAVPPTTAEPHHPADPLSPNTADPPQGRGLYRHSTIPSTRDARSVLKSL